MEAINSGLVDWAALYLFAKKLFLGSAAFGIFLGSLYFSYYLLRLYRLPRQSKEFRHQREHFYPENLLRYVITIICMMTVSSLFYFYVEIGQESMHLGAVIWVVVLSVLHLQDNMKAIRLKEKKQKEYEAIRQMNKQ